MARTAGRHASWGVLAALALLVAAPPMGCDSETPTGANEPVELTTVLQDGDQLVITGLEAFRTEATTLLDAVEDWAADPESDGSRSAAQDAWLTTMASWQEAELLQVGPGASSLTAVGGLDLRDEIYSWPTISPCRVDQETVEDVFDAPDFFEANLVNVYGLDGLEHLLFAGPDNLCPNQVPINAEGTWDALGESAIAEHRARFAVAMVNDILDKTNALLDLWNTEFSLTTSFDSEQEALNALFDAMFYLETRTKDRKIAEPAGLGECITDCAGLAESLESGTSHLWIAANLAGFHRVFTGGEGAGYDDLLRANGQAELADQILVALETAAATASAFTTSIDDAAVNDPDALRTLHDDVKAVTDLLKGDLATTLALQIPEEAAGDND